MPRPARRQKRRRLIRRPRPRRPQHRVDCRFHSRVKLRRRPAPPVPPLAYLAQVRLEAPPVLGRPHPRKLLLRPPLRLLATVDIEAATANARTQNTSATVNIKAPPTPPYPTRRHFRASSRRAQTCCRVADVLRLVVTARSQLTARSDLWKRRGRCSIGRWSIGTDGNH